MSPRNHPCSCGSGRKPVSELSDEELAGEIREQVNKSRFDGRHDRDRTRELGEEARKRGWNLG